MGRAQRIVLVIGIGLVLGFAGLWATAPFNTEFGWVAYASITGKYLTWTQGGHTSAAQLLIWLALILGWTGASLVILGPWGRLTGREERDGEG